MALTKLPHSQNGKIRKLQASSYVFSYNIDCFLFAGKIGITGEKDAKWTTTDMKSDDIVYG